MPRLSPIVWLDLETGGTDPRVHQITQIGAVATEGNTLLDEIGEPFEVKLTLVDGHYTEEALGVQQYNADLWMKEAVPAEVALRKFIDWIKPFTSERVGRSSGKTYQAASVGGFNVSFDADFLRATADRHKLWLPLTLWTGGMFDVLSFAKWVALMDGAEPPGYKLEDVCKHYGIRTPDSHDALADARSAATLARCLLMGW